LNPAPATTSAPAISSTERIATTTNASAVGPIGAIVRNPLGRLGR
jgi:hypothetical protein